jgi:hypothetical protein
MDDQINELNEPVDSYDEDLFAGPAPSWPKWIGGLAIAWGGIMLTCTGIGMVMLPMQAKFMGPMIEGAPMPDAFIVKPMDWAMMGVGLVMTFFLLFGGIFCVMRNPISRILILIWAIPSIPMSIYSFMVQMDKQASLQEWAKQYPDTQYAQMLNQSGAMGQQVGQIIGLVFTILLGVVVPAFFIIWFGFIKTKPEQMTGSEEVIA